MFQLEQRSLDKELRNTFSYPGGGYLLFVKGVSCNQTWASSSFWDPPDTDSPHGEQTDYLNKPLALLSGHMSVSPFTDERILHFQVLGVAVSCIFFLHGFLYTNQHTKHQIVWQKTFYIALLGQLDILCFFFSSLWKEKDHRNSFFIAPSLSSACGVHRAHTPPYWVYFSTLYRVSLRGSDFLRQCIFNFILSMQNKNWTPGLPSLSFALCITWWGVCLYFNTTEPYVLNHRVSL